MEQLTSLYSASLQITLAALTRLGHLTPI